ncbi:hypothetical protein JDV02_009630 [Purpureocillium takamizusanense]|uniref:Uncharacterized protein n=1 Tax=Purpureocillium takamizusanense TaxID=2060973 RepID=A0A9Q8QS35_9HYPO|nr:uncharacterized protein JDV02_009630 [Purpureocillium takamizusanense]UNI23836.1 hypothetical protein JDV02_009630 [Purpureocillium takamizusanense]
MMLWSALATGLAISVVLAADDSPPGVIVELCKQRGQVPQKAGDSWTCVQNSSICGEGEDQATLHKDAKTGEYVCCSPGYKLKDGRCVDPRPPPAPAPGTCAARIEDVGLTSLLSRVLAPCFPCGTTALDTFLTEYAGVLKAAMNLVEDAYSQPGCVTPKPSPGNWWKCPRDDDSPCKWLALENNKAPKTLAATGTDHRVLPNPNVPVANYKYPFDTWVTTWPDDDLDIYIKGEKVKPQASGTSYLIPAGTSGDDVYYKSSRGAQIQFYGACSPSTPCIGEEVVPWTQGKAVTVGDRDAVIDVSKYTSDGDLVFTIADTSVTTEQYTILADGKEVDKTHGRLTLGADKYNTKNIVNIDVGAGPWGALRSIANDGFWGSFRIPKGTQQVTVHMNFEAPGWPHYLFEYRIDKLCKC